MLEICVAVAKAGRHAAAESGDTLEIIEIPGGGFSFVLVSSEGSGRGAKTLSDLVASRVLLLLKDGARDSAVAQTVHDYLYTYRMGQVAATLNILSVDVSSGQIRMVRNNPAPFFVIDRSGTHMYQDEAQPIGLHAHTSPVVTSLPIAAYTYVVMFTASLLQAGAHQGRDMELPNYLAGWVADDGRLPDELTELLLQRAMLLDGGEIQHDISIATLAILPAAHRLEQHEGMAAPVRRFYLSVPFEHL
ncbi:MAG: SpoIIE family protein phosphatase [Chloroflexaceae bacterium]|nr:SpoIIE family protein phosphatase [Chloroflexaceae bacterium]